MNARPPDAHDTGWRDLWLSSWALSLALLGDSLLYVVLPLNADAFGIGLFWVGVLLAANRIVRIFTYGAIAALGERIGMKNLCLTATVSAVVSTAMYGLTQGWAPLLAARLLWGLSYAAMLLATLGYAASDRGRTGTRVGVTRSVEQVGPMLALTGGAWLAGLVGPQEVFVYLALASSMSIIFAALLPPLPVRESRREPVRMDWRIFALPRPDRLDILIFWMGFGVDGLFIMTLTIMLAGDMTIAGAMLSAGLIIAGRRLAEMVAAPASGLIADRWGVRRPFLCAAILLVAGFAGVGSGWLYTGALAIVLARGALGTLFPAAVVLFAPKAVLQPLARNQTWRDIGAAAGPLATGFGLTLTTPQALHLGFAIMFVASLLWLVASRAWRGQEEGGIQ